MSVISAPRTMSAVALDATEKYILSALFAFFAWRMIDAWFLTGSPVTLIYLVDQFVVLLFIMMRRPPKELSLRVSDWIVGIAGTFLALMIGPPSGASLVSPLIVALFMFVGFAIHFSAKLALRRSFGVIAANRGVKRSGPYRLVRHPMYLGYILTHVGILLAGPTFANVAVIGACWVFFVLRIVAEERVLLTDPAYRDFATGTRFRLIPGIY